MTNTIEPVVRLERKDRNGETRYLVTESGVGNNRLLTHEVYSLTVRRNYLLCLEDKERNCIRFGDQIEDIAKVVFDVAYDAAEASKRLYKEAERVARNVAGIRGHALENFVPIQEEIMKQRLKKMQIGCFVTEKGVPLRNMDLNLIFSPETRNLHPEKILKILREAGECVFYWPLPVHNKGNPKLIEEGTKWMIYQLNEQGRERVSHGQ